MSYILDALKKSEEKRGGMKLPAGMAKMSVQETSSVRRFGFPVILMMLALLAGWLLAMWQTDDKQAPVAAQKMNVMEQDSSVEPVDPLVHRVDQKVSLRDEQPQSIAVPQQTRVIHVEQQQPMFTPLTPESLLSRVVPPAPAQLEHAQQQIEAGSNVIEPTSNMPMSSQQAMPVIKIEGHIYDADPSARLVIINGVIRKENQMISTDLRLKEISLDGVVLQYQGKIYRMGVFDQ